MQVSGYDLGSSILFERRFGFTGTPSDLLPQELLVPKVEDKKSSKPEKPVYKDVESEEELKQATKWGADFAEGTEASIMQVRAHYWVQ